MYNWRRYFYSADFLIRAIFILLISLDFVLTVIVTKGGFTELNPLLKPVVNNSWYFLLIKSMGVFIAIMIPAKFLTPSIVLMFFVVAWNIKEIIMSSL